MNSRLLLVGRSVRAAAESAVRAGFTPRCIDTFADRETRRMDPRAVRVAAADYPARLPEIVAATVPPMEWAFTSDLENHVDVLRALDERGPLLGGPVEAVTAARDRDLLATIGEETGCPLPPAGDPATADPADGWIIRHPHSTGGTGIADWDGRALAGAERLERRLDGAPGAAICVATNDRVHLVGVTRQVVNHPAFPGPRYATVAALAPWPVPHPAQAALHRFARRVADATGLTGPFGIDFLLEPDQAVRPLEVNPRMTFGMAAWEGLTGASVLARPFSEVPVPDDRATGHAVVFAPHAGAVGDLPAALADGQITDRPATGQRVTTGDPVCTVTVAAAGIETCRQRLADIANALPRAFLMA